MAQAENHRVVFVDWAPPITSYDPYVLVTVHFEGKDFEFAKIKVAPVALCKDKVEKWKTRYLNPRRMKDNNASRDLSIINALVEPLGEFTREDDLLILSPTASLYNIPLHALQVDGDIVLKRNPVAYVPSFSVLQQCLKSLEAPEKGLRQPTDWSAAVMAVYHDLPDETQAVHDAMESLAQRLGTHAITEDDLTLAVFERNAAGADLIHFHGHGEFNTNNILGHRLILGEPSPVKVSEDKKHESGAREEISIREILQLQLTGPHVTLIACLSGVQQVNEEGDEPLGLVPAFLLAGATSIVSTLWTIKSEDGRKFTEAFYNYFLAGPAAHALGPVINLAIALQSSALLIRGANGTRQPYHWAGFALYGAWFCRSRPQTLTVTSTAPCG
jgi:CHAT domain-containing protein